MRGRAKSALTRLQISPQARPDLVSLKAQIDRKASGLCNILSFKMMPAACPGFTDSDKDSL